jgi:type I site-specific restriction-modification system R (restriction) subunit
MAEYINVEKPFLDKLRQIGWEVHDNGVGGVPQYPTDSFRTSFKEVILKEKFEAVIKKLNPWITEEQFKYCFEKISEQGNKKLLEANKDIFNLFSKVLKIKLIYFNPTTNQSINIAPPTHHAAILPLFCCFVSCLLITNRVLSVTFSAL